MRCDCVVVFHAFPRIEDNMICVGNHERLARGFDIKEISFEGMHSVCDSVMSAAKDSENMNIFVSGTVLDRAYCAAGIPGGLSTRELMYFLHRLSMVKNFRKIDFEDVDEDLRLKLSSALAKPL